MWRTLPPLCSGTLISSENSSFIHQQKRQIFLCSDYHLIHIANIKIQSLIFFSANLHNVPFKWPFFLFKIKPACWKIISQWTSQTVCPLDDAVAPTLCAPPHSAVCFQTTLMFVTMNEVSGSYIKINILWAQVINIHLCCLQSSRHGWFSNCHNHPNVWTTSPRCQCESVMLENEPPGFSCKNEHVVLSAAPAGSSTCSRACVKTCSSVSWQETRSSWKGNGSIL